MIGLIAAEKAETSTLIKKLDAKVIEFNSIRYYVGTLNDKQVVMCFCGIGKANAAAAAMNMIANFGVDAVFNIGLCGSCRSNVIPSSVLIANKLQYYDVDVTPLNYPLNQIPDEPIEFECHESDILKLKHLYPDAIVGTIASGDSFITINNISAFQSLGSKEIIGYDMEAAAIAQICNKTKTNFICMKVVSDNVMFDQDAKDQYKTNYKDLAKKIEKICIEIFSEYNK